MVTRKKTASGKGTGVQKRNMRQLRVGDMGNAFALAFRPRRETYLFDVSEQNVFHCKGL